MFGIRQEVDKKSKLFIAKCSLRKIQGAIKNSIEMHRNFQVQN